MHQYSKAGVMAGALLMPLIVLADENETGEVERLQEITVTAQRRSERLQDVPIAVTALSADSLQKSGITTTADLPTITPGLTMPATSGFLTPHIRGVGTAAYGAGLENSVATYVDGVYYVSAPASLLNLINIAQVEVLKGPQGTLFGRNATGGLIQITTLDPTADFHGNASVSYGDYQTASTNAYVTGRIGPSVAADLAVFYLHQGQGYGTNFFNGEPVGRDDMNYSARSKWLVTLDDNTQLRVAIDFARDVGNQLQSNHTAPGTVQAFGPPSPGRPWDTDEDFQPFNDFKCYGASAKLDHEFGPVRLTDIVAYRKSQFGLGFDADLEPLPLETIRLFMDDEHQFSEELLLTGGSSAFTWVAGGYYLTATGGYHPTDLALGGPLQIPLGPTPAPAIDTLLGQGDQKTTTAAGYGQVTLAVTDKTHLTLGLRYTYEKRELEATETGFSGSTLIGPLIAPIAGEQRKYYKPTWRASLDRRLSDDVLAYISYNRGFKSGGFNVGVPTDKPFEPEVLDAYEIGLKSDWLEHRLRLNPSVYYYDYKDIQVAHYVLGNIGYYNGARAKIYGLDLDAEAQLTAALTLRGGVEYTHDRFSSFPNALIYRQLSTGGTDIELGSAQGNDLPFTPTASVNIAGDYVIPLPVNRLTLNASYYFNSGWFSAPDNTLHQPAYHVVNASIQYGPEDERYSIKLWGRNLANEAVATALNASAISSLAQFQPPRTYGLTLSRRF